ncbi:hypothetical protein [Longimicrobium terrae]|uniref:Uncharacterized protein n=1 Tax=Longimicrobium terrae TaxID=1639882 RepID=A0A841GY03_9BACT|nr:hypothetical protein [Longimicrobium terrae]MBB4636240.1 hypothetical protein [Longimicrobium terrae]MBB6070635.1 hypothetical protein [Longimicrobium terrae]NNC29619.1 hypothetical protein [Longimicrobium terrae]
MRVQAARTARVAALLILTAPAACDNVEWGGASVQVVTPPPPGGEDATGPEPGAIAGMALPTGPVLFHVIRAQNGIAQLIPVAEISGDSLRTIKKPAGVSPQAYEQRFREAVMPLNAQFVLFRRGSQVGTLTIQTPSRPTACGVPTAQGQATTVAAAAAEGEFLAFRKGLAPDVMGEYSPPQVDGTIRRYASLVAERLVLQNGLQRPRSWGGAMRDLQALDLIRGGHPEMASTYLVGDQIGLGAAEPDAWSVFYVGDYEQRAGYTPIYQEVRSYAKTGKGAPKAVDHLNWNGAGQPELLIQIFGVRESWYEAISRDGGTWRKTWEAGRCIDQAPEPRSIGAAQRVGTP